MRSIDTRCNSSLQEPEPRFIQVMADSSLFGAVAREVVEAYGDDIPAHPVGTGPFRLVEWRRSSRIVLERNPTYREVLYDAEPNADDAEGQALLQRFKGRRLPMIDRVEISIIEEVQPRWLSFLNKQSDLSILVPFDFVNIAAPNGKLAPFLAKQDVQLYRTLASDVSSPSSTWKTRWSAAIAPDKVALAPGHRARIQHRSGNPSVLARTSNAGAIAAHAEHAVGYDAGYIAEEVTPRSREGDALCSTCMAMLIAMATAGVNSPTDLRLFCIGLRHRNSGHGNGTSCDART